MWRWIVGDGQERLRLDRVDLGVGPVRGGRICTCRCHDTKHDERGTKNPTHRRKVVHGEGGSVDVDGGSSEASLESGKRPASPREGGGCRHSRTIIRGKGRR